MCMTGRQCRGQTRYLVGYLYRTWDGGGYSPDAGCMTNSMVG